MVHFGTFAAPQRRYGFTTQGRRMKIGLEEAVHLMQQALAILDRESARFAAVHLQHAISVATAEQQARLSALQLEVARRPN